MSKLARMTNYSMIKTFSIEQMALTIMCPNDSDLADIDCVKADSNDCYDCCLRWLKQETDIEPANPEVSASE